MKLLIIFALSLFHFPSGAQPANDGIPLVAKTSITGFVPPAWRKSEVCKVYRNKVIIIKSFGLGDRDTVTVRQEMPLTISPNITRMLTVAGTEVVERRTNNVCDGPKTQVVAYRANARRENENFILFDSGGCGRQRAYREGPASDALREIVNSYCQKTYDSVDLK